MLVATVLQYPSIKVNSLDVTSVIKSFYLSKVYSMLFRVGVVLSNCFYVSLLIPKCFSQTFIEGQPPNWANRLITITNKA